MNPDVLSQAWHSEQGQPSEQLEYQPFPIMALPSPMCDFVAAGSETIGCDPVYLALPILTAAAASIGNTRRLALKRTWEVPPIIWGAIVGESGTSKTPALTLALQPIHNLQAKAFKLYQMEVEKYKQRLIEWNKAKKKDRGEPPPEPVCTRCVVSDTTIEALATVLSQNKRGVLLARDELAGWFGGFDRYAKNGRYGSDSASWLSMYNAGTLMVDRKTGIPRAIYIPKSAVCIIGGIQPEILRRALRPEHRESGLASRILMAYPPRQVKQWTEAEIDRDILYQMTTTFCGLHDLQFRNAEECEPEMVALSEDARSVWIDYYNEHAEEQAELEGDLASAWAKLEECAARLALVIHCVRTASDAKTALVMDADSMRCGIALARWFAHEARRIYTMLDESDEARECRRLAEWIRLRGGTVTPRDVQRGLRRLRAPGSAESALEELARTGYGTWSDDVAGSRRVFTLVS